MTEAMRPATILTDAVDELLAQLQQHEEAAASIRTTLAELRRKMAGGGKRAGAKARSGKKRKLPTVPENRVIREGDTGPVQ
jgi:hypothetical protein